MMKSLKNVFVTVCVIAQLPLFGMDFLDPVLKNNSNDREIITIQENTLIDEQECLHENISEKRVNIENKICSLCSQQFGNKFYARDYIECTACDEKEAFVHTECLKNEILKRAAQKNGWRFCPVCDGDYTQKENKQHLKTLPPFVKEMIQRKTKEEQTMLNEQLLKKDLILQSCMSTLLTFGMIYSHQNFHWTIDFSNSFIFGLLDSYYGLSSAQLHTSSDIRIKLLGKCLYVLANKIIPAYTLYKSLNKKVLSDALFTSLQINKPNKIQKMVIPSESKKQTRDHYYHELPLLVYIIQEARNKDV